MKVDKFWGCVFFFFGGGGGQKYTLKIEGGGGAWANILKIKRREGVDYSIFNQKSMNLRCFSGCHVFSGLFTDEMSLQYIW